MAKSLSVSELDFDAIKDNLKQFLESQTAFDSYNFEGATLSVMLDMLAYNTHYNSIYNNLALNETFLDSASKRISVVSRAKDLGYTPASCKAPRAKINLRITTPSYTGATLVLPKLSIFTTVVDSIQYQFYTTEDITTTRVSNEYLFTNVEILEGKYLTNKYIYTEGMKIVIPNKGIDISTLKVNVQENPSSGIFTTYRNSETLLDIKSTDRVYFVKEIDNELYELEFGNDRVGKALELNQIITVTYFVTNKTAANGAKVFSYTGGIGSGTPVVTTVQAAIGGSDIEGIETIRFNAPKYYASQNRAITTQDYNAIITKNYPNIDSISVWGGEDNTPPVYGKVFISIKPTNKNVLTADEKNLIIQDILANKTTLTVTPEIVDPNIILIEVESYVYYDSNLTTKSPQDLKTEVIEAIEDYNANINQFNSILRYSNLSKTIDSVERSIVSNTTKLKIHRLINPVYGVPAKYIIQLGNPIDIIFNKPSIQSSGFFMPEDTTQYFIEDDSNGNLNRYYLDSANIKIVKQANVGTVDYNNGVVTIDLLTIDSLAEPDFKLIIVPGSYDILANKNNTIKIDSSLLKVNILSSNNSQSSTQIGTDYVFNDIK